MLEGQLYSVMIGTNATRTQIPGALVMDTTTGDSELAAGEIAIVGPDMKVLAPGSTVTDAEFIYIVQGVGVNQVVWSPKVKGSDVLKWEGTVYTAETLQISYVGYDTAGGSVNVLNDTEYSLHIIFKHNWDVYTNRQERRSFFYTTDATATQTEIVSNFVTKINADPVCSQYLTASSVDDGTNFGIKLLAKALTYNSLDYDHPYVNFDVYTDLGFTSATEVASYGWNRFANSADTQSVKPFPGVGTFKQASDLERAALGYLGATNRRKFPIPAITTYAVLGATYDVYSLTYNSTSYTPSLGERIATPLHIYILIPAGASGGNGTNFEAVINPWLASTPKAFAPITL